METATYDVGQIGHFRVVFDTLPEYMPGDLVGDRPWEVGWEVGHTPGGAVAEFLEMTGRLEIDWDIEHKLLITVARNRYLKCTKGRL